MEKLVIGTGDGLYYLGTNQSADWDFMGKHDVPYKVLSRDKYEKLSCNDTAWMDLVDLITKMAKWDSITPKNKENKDNLYNADMLYFHKKNGKNDLKLKVRYCNGYNTSQKEGWGFEIGEVLGDSSKFEFKDIGGKRIERHIQKKLNTLDKFDCPIKELTYYIRLGLRSYKIGRDRGTIQAGEMAAMLGIQK